MRAHVGVANFVLSAAALIVLAGGFGSALAEEQHRGHDMTMQKSGHDQTMRMHRDDEVVLKGEVLDLYCFMNHPGTGQGADHAKCGGECISKGLPIGFLSNGEVYLILGKEHESVTDVVADYIGVQSLMTGKLVEHHGLKAIEFSAIAKADVSK